MFNLFSCAFPLRPVHTSTFMRLHFLERYYSSTSFYFYLCDFESNVFFWDKLTHHGLDVSKVTELHHKSLLLSHQYGHTDNSLLRKSYKYK